MGSGELWGYRTDPSMPDDIRAAATPSAKADNAIGQWNRFFIRMRGDRVTVVLNGVTVIEDAMLPDVPAQGPIGLQSHGSGVTFSNILIRKR